MLRVKRVYGFLAGISVCLLLGFVFCPETVKSKLNFFARVPRVAGRPGHHWILMWHHPFDVQAEGPAEGTKAGECTVTYDRGKLKEASAVVFDFSALDREEMPWRHYRHPDQMFLFLTMESPSYLRIGEGRDLKKFDQGFINWTMTYKASSDIHYSYFETAREILKDGKKRVDELLAKKKNVALWIVSNCDLLPASRARMRFSDELVQTGLPLHRYGGCFQNKQELANLPHDVIDSYKFYMAFENALHCDQYLTEKFWRNSLNAGRVPVVWGASRADVARLAPPGSYIHAEDYASPAELVKYLLHLHENDDEYRRYFDWRSNPDERTMEIVAANSLIRERQICDRLQRGFERKIIPSISDWMFAGETEECLQTKDVAIKP